MPTYEYKCDKCGPFEIWQSIKDDALTACPTCGARVERLISANVGFVFKGAGFYQNDYKNPPGPAKATPDGSSTAGAVSGSSKPEAPDSTTAPSSSGPGCGTCGGPDPCSSGN
jgi:putative FmdB family regulatory protein